MRLVLALLLLVAAPAAAQVCTDSACTAILTYTEPTTYTDGSPLKDLKEGVFTYHKDNGPAQTARMPASSPKGGGQMALETAPQTVPPCTKATLTGSLVMHTLGAKQSVPSVAPPLTIDRTKLASGEIDPACQPVISLWTQCREICALDWTTVDKATQYKIGRCVKKNRCPGEAMNADWLIVAVTSGTSVTVEPPVGLSDYAVFAIQPDGTAKMLSVRTTVTRASARELPIERARGGIR